MPEARRIAMKIASNSPTAVQAVKRAVHMGEGEPIEQAIPIMMEAHWRSAVHPDRLEASAHSTKTASRLFKTPTINGWRDDHQRSPQDDRHRCHRRQHRAALAMIEQEPNAEAPPYALKGGVTPTDLHYVRSNFALPEHDGTLDVAGAVENALR